MISSCSNVNFFSKFKATLKAGNLHNSVGDGTNLLSNLTKA